MFFKNYYAKISWLLIFAVSLSFQDVWILGKKVANYLAGKHKPIYHPFTDCGDHVVVINCKDVAMHGFNWKNQRFFFDMVCSALMLCMTFCACCVVTYICYSNLVQVFHLTLLIVQVVIDLHY